jgi:hypothetical protein
MVAANRMTPTGTGAVPFLDLVAAHAAQVIEAVATAAEVQPARAR